MKELSELEQAALNYQRTLNSTPILGWCGAGTTTALVSQFAYDRLLAAGERWNRAITEAHRRAFA